MFKRSFRGKGSGKTAILPFILFGAHGLVCYMAGQSIAGRAIVLVLLLLGLCRGDGQSRDSTDGVPKLYGGDMALTPEQATILYPTHSQQLSDDEPAQTRAALKGTRQLWPNGIVPFTFSRTIDEAGRNMIKEAMKEWEDNTCIRFKRRENERGYIEFVNKQGCWSYLGFLDQRQEISIGRFTGDPPCEKGSLIHELGHAMGFFHEHMRPDRDDFVHINWHNMRGGQMVKDQFLMAPPGSVDSRGVPYDYGSIMHYNKYQGNNRVDAVVMEPINPPNAAIGQRKGLSKLDIKQIKLMYDCDKEAGPTNTKKPVTTLTPIATWPAPMPSPAPTPRPAPTPPPAPTPRPAIPPSQGGIACPQVAVVNTTTYEHKIIRVCNGNGMPLHPVSVPIPPDGHLSGAARILAAEILKPLHPGRNLDKAVAPWLRKKLERFNGVNLPNMKTDEKKKVVKSITI